MWEPQWIKSHQFATKENKMDEFSIQLGLNASSSTSEWTTIKKKKRESESRGAVLSSEDE